MSSSDSSATEPCSPLSPPVVSDFSPVVKRSRKASEFEKSGEPGVKRTRLTPPPGVRIEELDPEPVVETKTVKRPRRHGLAYVRPKPYEPTEPEEVDFVVKGGDVGLKFAGGRLVLKPLKDPRDSAHNTLLEYGKYDFVRDECSARPAEKFMDAFGKEGMRAEGGSFSKLNGEWVEFRVTVEVIAKDLSKNYGDLAAKKACDDIIEVAERRIGYSEHPSTFIPQWNKAKIEKM